ncbi:MAG: response regulator [Chitinophagaceae bacterium]|nr:response regulator [Chitinophagaceae bacterium]
MKRIFLIEDDPNIRDSLSILLSKSYDLQMDRNGEALMNHSIIPPDLFILDRNISGVTGVELCRFIRQEPKYRSTPVIMLSASPDILNEAKRVGANGAIEKPFKMCELLDMINLFTTKELSKAD